MQECQGLSNRLGLSGCIVHGPMVREGLYVENSDACSGFYLSVWQGERRKVRQGAGKSLRFRFRGYTLKHTLFLSGQFRSTLANLKRNRVETRDLSLLDLTALPQIKTPRQGVE